MLYDGEFLIYSLLWSPYVSSLWYLRHMIRTTVSLSVNVKVVEYELR